MNRVAQIVIATLLATILVIVSMGLILPREYRVEQSVLINAAPKDIHHYVGDFRNWTDWANFTKQDPTLQFEYEGPAQGVGSIRRWQGERTGLGALEITKYNPETGICFDERVRDNDVSGRGCIEYTAEGGATRVTWTDTGKLAPIVGGFFRSFVSDNIAKTFEIALGRLKQRVENPESASAATTEAATAPAAAQ